MWKKNIRSYEINKVKLNRTNKIKLITVKYNIQSNLLKIQ